MILPVKLLDLVFFTRKRGRERGQRLTAERGVGGGGRGGERGGGREREAGLSGPGQ